LSTRPLGDADLLVVVLTPGFGKVRAAARNARRSRRRFAGGLPGGALGQATLVPGRTGLWRLEAFEMLRALDELGRDLDRFAYVAYLCELTDALVQEPEPSPQLFASLSEAIDCVLDLGPRPAILRRHELALLHGLGLLPAFELCCVCGVPVSEDPSKAPVHFEPERGGVLCPSHRGDAPTIDPRVLAVACALLDRETGTVAEAVDRLESVEAQIRRALRDLTAGLVRAQLRRPLRSLEFFAKLGRPPGGP
jgi:DNA repair protein RecO (recombination protein O)